MTLVNIQINIPEGWGYLRFDQPKTGDVILFEHTAKRILLSLEGVADCVLITPTPRLTDQYLGNPITIQEVYVLLPSCPEGFKWKIESDRPAFRPPLKGEWLLVPSGEHSTYNTRHTYPTTEPRLILEKS